MRTTIRRCGILAALLVFGAVATVTSIASAPAFAQGMALDGWLNGAVRVGPSILTCDASREGSMRYNITSKCIELCNATSWACISVGACADASPNGFDFTDLANQSTSTLVTSNILQITGISCTVSVAVSGEGSPQFRTCSNSSCTTVVQDWTTGGTISNNEYVQLRLTTSAAGGDTYSATLAIGTGADVWNATPTGDCTGSPAAGTVCADGTVYAGLSPDGNVKMYVTRCDAGQTWDGTACTGTRNGQTWNDGLTGWTATGYTSAVTGETNTTNIVPIDSNNGLGGTQPHIAAAYCDGLNQHGSTDWYLPALNELNVVYGNRAVIGGLDTSGSSYWSSTENYNTNAWHQRFSDGAQNSYSKDYSHYVRCARR